MAYDPPAYDPDNVFAKIMRGELPSVQVYEDDATLVIMDLFPRAEGHALVIPKTPARNVLDASPDQLAACMETVQKIGRASLTAFGAGGITVQQFNEAVGGQEVFHLHFHVIPRHEGDRLKPPATDMATPEALQESGAKIRAALA